ncbi:MAG TPA: LamG domain-containing protein [Roseateles sp.]
MSQLQDIAGAGSMWAGPNVRIDTTNTLYGSPSIPFDGAGVFFTQGINKTDHQLQSGDFVIDGYARFEGLGAGQSLGVILGKASSGNQSYYLSVNGAGSLSFNFSTNGSSGGIVSVTGPAPIGSFYHFEVGRSGNTFYLFIDGDLKATAAYSGTFYNSSDPLNIGRINVSAFEYYFKGQLRELRIRKGVGPHTASFTPPTAPPVADGSETLFVRGTEFVTHTVAKGVALVTRIAGSSPNWSLSGKTFTGARQLRDEYHGGTGRIKGRVSKDKRVVDGGLPLRRRVLLLRERDRLVVRELWSSAVDGSYSFDWVAKGYTYSAIAFDHLHGNRAEIADNQTPEDMP